MTIPGGITETISRGMLEKKKIRKESRKKSWKNSGINSWRFPKVSKEITEEFRKNLKKNRNLSRTRWGICMELEENTEFWKKLHENLRKKLQREFWKISLKCFLWNYGNVPGALSGSISESVYGRILEGNPRKFLTEFCWEFGEESSE